MIRKKAIYLKGLFSNYINNQINIISQIDWLLPNASSEMKVLNDRLGLDLNNFNIVYNSIDIKLYDTITKHNKIKKDNNIITFPARIDQRKNQLNFLKSMIDTDYEIRFIGSPGKNSNSYYTKLKKIAKLRGNVKFISEISQEELFKHMLEAKVNVLTSWVETPGLVSLEAAYAGCNLVVSDKGSVRDYFKNFAFYCNPANIENIKKQTIRAMNSDFNEGFRTLIREEYSYSKAAQDTLDVYKKIL